MQQTWKQVLVACLAGSTLLGNAFAAPWIMRHAQSNAAYQNMYDNELPAGYRPISVNVNGTTSDPRYTTVWVNDGVPASDWIARHGMTSSEYQDNVTDFAEAGYRVLAVDAVGEAPNELYVATWVRDSLGTSGNWAATHGATSVELNDLDALYSTQGFRMTWISTHGTSNARRFAAVWVRNFEGWSYEVDVDIPEAFYQDQVSLRCRQGFRLVSVTVCESPRRFAAVWLRPDGNNWDLQPQWQARHDQDGAVYQDYVSDLYPTSYQALCAIEYGSAGNPRYASTWFNDRGPLQWSQKGKNVPEMFLVDDAMQDYMVARKISHAQIAVTFEGRLIYNQGYTYAPADEAPTTVNSRFRIASIAKPLTAAAIMKLDEDGFFGEEGLDKRISDYPVFDSDAWCDSRFADVTIRHLLMHTGGWDRSWDANDPNKTAKCAGDGSGGQWFYFDPQFMDTFVEEELGGGFPVSELDIIDYMKNFGLNHAPGTVYEYSNFGYNLLGRVIESATNVPYETWVRNNILCPVGAEGMYMGGTTLAEIQPGEVPYVDPMGRCSISVIDGVSLVPAAYGGWNQQNMGAHGGWVGKASELARFIADLDKWNDSTLLKSQSIFDMWNSTPISNNSYGMGFQMSGNMVYHNGSLTGAWCYMVRRPDGITYTMLFNQQMRAFENPHQGTSWDVFWDMRDVFDTMMDPATGGSLPNHNLFGINRCGAPEGFTTPDTRPPSKFTRRRP